MAGFGEFDCGLPNRQIVDRLVVLVRTVESHLYRACAKFGRRETGSVLKRASSITQAPPAAHGSPSIERKD